MTIIVNSTKLNKATNYISMYDRVALPYNKPYNNCNNTLCYTYSKNFIYKPHSGYGAVGTTAQGYLFRRKKL